VGCAVSASERPQLAPSGQSERLGRGDDVGGAEPHHRPGSLIEAERHHQRQVGDRGDRLGRPQRLFDREERLEHEQVGAAVGQRAGLFAERLQRELAAERPSG